MKSYSIHYLDVMGRTLTTDMMSFVNETGAVEFALGVQEEHAIVEIWRDTTLVKRLFRHAPAPLDRTLAPSVQAAAAFSRADVHRYAEGSE